MPTTLRFYTYGDKEPLLEVVKAVEEELELAWVDIIDEKPPITPHIWFAQVTVPFELEARTDERVDGVTEISLRLKEGEDNTSD